MLVMYMVVFFMGRTRACCIWEYNTTLSSINNVTEKIEVVDETECCDSCMKKQLYNVSITMAVFSKPFCFCLPNSPTTKEINIKTAIVYGGRTLQFSDDAKDSFGPNEGGVVYINYCGQYPGNPSLLVKEETQLNEITDIVYFDPLISPMHHLHPVSKKAYQMEFPFATDGDHLYFRNTQQFKIGSVNETKDVLLLLVSSNSDSITVSFKNITVNKSPKNGFIKVINKYRGAYPYFAMTVEIALLNNHIETNCDLDAFVFIYYDNMKLTLMHTMKSVKYANLIEYSQSPLMIKVDIALGGQLVVNSILRHLDISLNNYTANFMIEVFSTQCVDGIRSTKEPFTKTYLRKYTPDIKDFQLLYVHFILFDDRLLYCYHKKIGVDNFCAIYNLMDNSIKSLPRVLLRPICYKLDTGDFFFYDHFGVILKYDVYTWSVSHVNKTLVSILNTGECIRPITGIANHFYCCGYYNHLKHFNDGTLLSATVYGWHLNSRLIVRWKF